MTKILLGAHTSTAGGVHNALLEGQAIGCTTVQLFTSNQRQWKARSLSQEDVDLFHRTSSETGLSHIMSHASYLINLGAPDDELLLKGRNALREEVIRSLQLGISYITIHPGSAVQGPIEQCLERVVESLLSVKDLFSKKTDLQILVETMPGQGSQIGHSFEEIRYIVHQLKDSIPIGVCMDTCHIFAAGYDIRTKTALDTMVKEFDQKVGLPFLKAMHLNDSFKGLNSRRDRHAPIGEGELGVDAFEFIMNHEDLKALPKYLETPGGLEVWRDEIALLRSFVK